MPRPVLLAGPTASGKSELAMLIAERDNGVVINADALQVYGCWRILTARPSVADTGRVPHLLYGHVDGFERYSVGRWLADLAPALADVTRQGLRPIIVGGTGLYLSALTEGLAEIPPVEGPVRARSQAFLASGEISAMVADLQRLDPATSARIDLANPMRVQRAWDVLMSTGRGLSAWQAEPARPLLPFAACDCYVLHPGVPVQHASAEARFRRMVRMGALEECRAFLAAGVPPAAPSARALGAGPLLRHLTGEFSLETAIAEAVIATRQYAKRQRTWLRGRMAHWSWLASADLRRISGGDSGEI